LARDAWDVYVDEAGIITLIAVSGDEEVCASGGILLGRLLPFVVDVGRG